MGTPSGADGMTCTKGPRHRRSLARGVKFLLRFRQATPSPSVPAGRKCFSGSNHKTFLIAIADVDHDSRFN